MSPEYLNGDARDDELDSLWNEAAVWSEEHIDVLADDIAEAVERRDNGALRRALTKMARVLAAFNDLADEIGDTEGEDYDDEEE